jgi:L-alanine-DL-glutamate epimerase-like enolase superfamily enzyme
LAGIITNSGIEGNYTLGARYWHPDWNNEGWGEYARGLLTGKNALDRPELTSQWVPARRRRGQSSYAAAIDNCLWDIVGKVANLPVYQLLGAYRHRVLAYASSQHLKTVEDFVESVKKCKAEGFRAYKIHPPQGGPYQSSDYKLDMEVCRAVRKTAGDDFTLLMDPVGVYTRQEAMALGRLLDELKFAAFEDPIPTKDIEGLVELTRALDTPIHIGEFIFSIYDFPEYIRRGATDVVRFIVDNVGGITGGMKLAAMSECFGMECAPHNWGDTLDHAVHFHCELAMPNNLWFEMTVPQGVYDAPYMKDHIRVAEDGYVYAPAKPGLGYEIDRHALDNLTKRLER